MKFRIRKQDGDWLLEEKVSDGLYVEIITVGSHEGACREMDHEVWLQHRDLFPGKTLTDSRRRYRRGRLGSHVEKDRMRAGWAQDAVAGGTALVAGALLHPVPEDGD